MWSDRMIAAVALLVLIVFLGVLVVYVQRIDLTVVVVVGCAMAIFDFYRELRA